VAKKLVFQLLKDGVALLKILLFLCFQISQAATKNISMKKSRWLSFFACANRVNPVLALIMNIVLVAIAFMKY
jgi:hypothetical protein